MGREKEGRIGFNEAVQFTCDDPSIFSGVLFGVDYFVMYLRPNRPFKDGEGHRYWSIVESKRCAGGKVVQRQVLYLGEINGSQQEAYILVVEEALWGGGATNHPIGPVPRRSTAARTRRGPCVRIRLGAMQLHRPRQWGACWLARHLYEQLELDCFWAARLPEFARRNLLEAHSRDAGLLPAHRSGQRVAPAPAVVRAKRHGRSARRRFCAGREERSLSLPRQARSSTNRRCSRTCAGAGRNLFGARFDVLLYDLTSTYFESEPPSDDSDKRRHGYRPVTSARTVCRWSSRSS